MDQKKLDQQSQHWEASFSNKPKMFGLEPSYSAQKALEIFKKITEEFNINAVFTNRDYEPYALDRDAEIESFLNKKNIVYINNRLIDISSSKIKKNYLKYF